MSLVFLVVISMVTCAGTTIGMALSVLLFDEDAGLVKKLFYVFQLVMCVTFSIVIFKYGTQIWALFG